MRNTSRESVCRGRKRSRPTMPTNSKSRTMNKEKTGSL